MTLKVHSRSLEMTLLFQTQSVMYCFQDTVRYLLQIVNTPFLFSAQIKANVRILHVSDCRHIVILANDVL